MKKTVFISSTYEDLKNHRRKIWELLGNFDVIVRGMERFGARKETPLQTCLAEVEQSDIFIGIIACKVGSIEKISGKSFVQKEYEKAYELGKEILIYLIDEKNAKVSVQNIDFGENREKLISFKSILKDRHTVDFFLSEDTICEKLNRRFKELLESKSESPSNKSNEYDDSKTVIEKFLLVPKLYSGNEIKLKLDFNNDPFPASRAICNSFNLDYGKTIGVKIKIKEPKDASNFVNYLFINKDKIDVFLKQESLSDVEVYVKLEWTENEVADVKANFVRKVYDIYPCPSFWLESSLGNIPGFQKEVVEAEGTIITLLSEFA
jgi:hypothetical protein